MSQTEQYTSTCPEQTCEIGAELVRRMAGPSIIALHGELGSGKTCFVQGIADALEIGSCITSPTFTIINEYPAPRPLYHIDLYRLHDPQEVIMLGLTDYFESEGITAIEWAERAGDILPKKTTHVYFQLTSSPHTREIIIKRGNHK